jgi:hypothetical protein
MTGAVLGHIEAGIFYRREHPSGPARVWRRWPSPYERICSLGVVLSRPRREARPPWLWDRSPWPPLPLVAFLLSGRRPGTHGSSGVCFTGSVASGSAGSEAPTTADSRGASAQPMPRSIAVGINIAIFRPLSRIAGVMVLERHLTSRPDLWDFTVRRKPFRRRQNQYPSGGWRMFSGPTPMRPDAGSVAFPKPFSSFYGPTRAKRRSKCCQDREVRSSWSGQPGPNRRTTQ